MKNPFSRKQLSNTPEPFRNSLSKDSKLKIVEVNYTSDCTWALFLVIVSSCFLTWLLYEFLVNL